MNETAIVLEKLGFSFWQLLIVVFVFYYRKEVKALIGRVVNVKIGDSEIKLSADKSLVFELSTLQDKLEKEQVTPDYTRNLIKEVIDEKVLTSIGNIKKYTYDLWERIEKEHVAGSAFMIEIPSATLSRIRKDLEILDAARYFRYNIMDLKQDDNRGDFMYQLRIEIVSKEFGGLIDKLM
ncbi:hypothetical protein ACFL2V_13665 [Pseudomonadota bacterium]